MRIDGGIGYIMGRLLGNVLGSQAVATESSDKDKDPQQGGQGFQRQNPETIKAEDITDAMIQEVLVELAKLEAFVDKGLQVRVLTDNQLPGRRIAEISDSEGKVVRRLNVVELVNMLKQTANDQRQGRLINRKA